MTSPVEDTVGITVSPLAPVSTDPRRVSGRSLALLLLLAVVVGGCQRLLIDPAPAVSSIRLALAPAVELASDSHGGPFDAVDRVLVRIERQGKATIEELRDFDPSLEETIISIVVQLTEEVESARITVELRSGTAVLFQAVRDVELRQGAASFEMDIAAFPDHVRIDGPEVLQIASLGESVQLSGTVAFATGDPVPGTTVTWSSTNSSVATVSSAGRVVIRGEGTARIRAAFGGLVDEVEIRVQQVVASVTVQPSSGRIEPGESLQLSADVRDARDNPITGRAVSWSSSSSAVTVSPNGLATGVELGTSLVTATVDGMSGHSSLEVWREAQELFEGLWHGSMEDILYYDTYFDVELVIDQNESNASGTVYLSGSYSEDGDSIAMQSFTAYPFSSALIDGETISFATADGPSGVPLHFGLTLYDASSLIGMAQECFAGQGCYDWNVSLTRADVASGEVSQGPGASWRAVAPEPDPDP